MGTKLVIVSTPSLQFRAGVVKAHEPVDVQTLRAELPVEGFDEGVVGRFPRPGEVEDDPLVVSTLGLSSCVVERLEAEIQLKLAVQRGEFVLHYQPQIEIGSGRIVGVEALARWQHPVHGLVPPAQFIPFAEETGMIEPIGEWVLRTACAQAAAWHRSGLPAMRMAINVSTRQFHDPALVSMVAQVLAEHGLAPERLELEITESMSMRDPEESCRILASFKALGISIAIDDFGTGYQTSLTCTNSR